MKLKLLIILALMVSRSYAQEWPSELWHDGKIVLLEGDTLKGLLKYDLQQNLVQYNNNNQRIEAFSARKVIFFEIFDLTVRKYRQFFALPYVTTTGYKTPVFFELLTEGKITLLAREFLESQSYSSPYYVGSYTRIVLTYKYFFLSETGLIEEFLGKKNDLLNKFGRKEEEVEKFMKVNRLKYDDKDDLTRIVAYYNSLF